MVSKDALFKILFFIGTIIVLNSCGTYYYYVKLDSNNPYIDKNDKSNFIVSGDSVELSYSFYGENAPVKINIHNKMNRKLFVNWRESWLIIGDGNSNRVNLASYMERWDGVSLVEPWMSKERLIFELSNLNFEQISDTSYKERTAIKSDGKTVRLKTVDYSEYNTPLYFRCILSLHFGTLEEEPIFFDQDFYIASVSKAKNMKPKELSVFSNKPGDHFYTRQEYGRAFVRVLSVTGEILFVAGDFTFGVLLGGY